MKRFVRRSRWRARASAPITLAYIALAIAIGTEGPVPETSFGISPMSSASALAILTSIGAGMMALTAIVFSLLLVAVQLGNSSYSPRLLRVLGDHSVLAHALGVFTGTFVYALLGIRAVDLGGGEGVAVSVVIIAFTWLLASLVVLAIMVPRIRSFMIGDILTALERRATSVAMRIYPTPTSPANGAPAEPPAVAITSVIRHSGSRMYVIGVDLKHLVQCARDADAVLAIPLAIGDAVLPGDRLVTVLGAVGELDDHEVRRAIWLGTERVLDNDPAYALRLYVDIAIRALSPAVNDPTTAVSVLDAIDGLLRQFGRLGLEDNEARDELGVVRVVRAVPSWDDLVALALTEIHQCGRDSLQVERRLATLLRDLPEQLPPQRRPALERFARWREHGVAPALQDAAGWIDPSASDRQGIGRSEVAAMERIRHAPTA